MTAPPRVLSPSSILPQPSSQSSFIPAGKTSGRLAEMLLFYLPYFTFVKVREPEVAYLVKWFSVWYVVLLACLFTD
jgi:hypothetical protein